MKKIVLIFVTLLIVSLISVLNINSISASLCKGNDYYYDCYQTNYNYPSSYSYKWDDSSYSNYNYRSYKYNFNDLKFIYYKDKVRDSFYRGYDIGYNHGFYDGYKMGYDEGHEIGYKHSYNDAKEKYKDKTKTSYYKNTYKSNFNYGYPIVTTKTNY